MLRAGVDIGGTFTDLCVVDSDHVVAVGKTLTTPHDPSQGVETVLAETLEGLGLACSDLRLVVHGTTLVTNAIIERKGSPTALLATQGFRDAVEIGRERRYELYDLMVELEKLTGNGVSLNTSLNRRGEPMICSPTDALNMFYGSDLQYLIMEDILVVKDGKDWYDSL